MVLAELPLSPEEHATVPVRVRAASAAMVNVRRIAIPFAFRRAGDQYRNGYRAGFQARTAKIWIIAACWSDSVGPPAKWKSPVPGSRFWLQTVASYRAIASR